MGDAVTTVGQTPDPGDWPAPRRRAEPNSEFADAPFRCLGYSGSPFGRKPEYRYHFRAPDGKVVSYAESQLTSKHLIQLTGGSRDWWAERFPRSDRRNPVDWSHAAAALIVECAQCDDLFDPERIRGTGSWRDEHGNVVVHLGDRLLAPGATRLIPPEEYDGGRFVYERSYVAPEPSWGRPLSLTEAKNLVKQLDRLPWDDAAAGALFAGFLALGPVCGALALRPHLVTTGSGASGRALLMAPEVVGGLLAEMYAAIVDPSDMRTDLVREAVVLVYNCPWQDPNVGLPEIRSVLKLARTSMTNTGVTIAAPSGLPREIAHRSMVLLSSPSLPDALSDELRGSAHHFHLRDPNLIAGKQERLDVEWARHWLGGLEGEPAHEMGRRLWARTLRWFRPGRFDRLLAVTTAVAEEVMEWPLRKAGYHVLAAGAMMLHFDAVPGKDEVREWFREKGLTSDAEDGARAGYDVLAQLLGSELELRLSQGSRDRIAVDTLLKYVIDGKPRFVPSSSATQIRKHDRWAKAKRGLADAGLRVEDEALLVANRSDWIEDQLADSPYAADWKGALRTIPRAHAGPPRRGVVDRKRTKSRTTVIPLRALKSALTSL